jgi:anthranilate synthase component 2
MLLMIDNYDSFTFNLVQYLGELGQEVKVVRNDALTVEQIRALAPSRIMISPGPGTPDEAGVSLGVLRELGGDIPVFGVCLGHQAIGQVFGGKVIRAAQITRYHSLVVEQGSLPECLEVTAWTKKDDGSIDEIMGLRHRTLDIEGVQFHPESILTQHGHDLLRNFLHLPLPIAA